MCPDCGELRHNDDCLDHPWADYEHECPNCGEGVNKEMQHYTPDTMIDPGWGDCDVVE